MSIIQGNALGGTPYTGDIQKSLRFAASRSTYLNRTPSTTTNQTKWTWSGWVKRGTADTNQGLFDAYGNSNNFSMLLFDTSNRLWFYNIVGGVDSDCVSTPVYRDPSSWMHVIFVYDTANATSADRFIFYVNGSRVSVTNPYGVPGLNEPCYVNANSALHCVGRITDNNRLLDGYLSRVCLVDGQALTPTSFGYTSIDTGEWVTRPQSDIKAVVDAGGANSFMLDFDNGTSLTTLGYDKSSKSNNWTLNNHSLTIGSNYDWTKDVPGNSYAVINPLIKPVNAGGYVDNGNLHTVSGYANAYNVFTTSTMVIPKGYKVFAEITCVSNAYASQAYLGCVAADLSSGATWNSSGVSTPAGISATFTSGDVIGIAADRVNNTVQFFKNSVSVGTLSCVYDGDLFFYAEGTGNAAYTIYTHNYGQIPFIHTPPSGFNTLCQRNMPEPRIKKPKEYFDIKTRAHTSGAAGAVTGIGFKPDLAWTKSRTVSSAHVLTNSVRGVTKQLFTDRTDAEQTTASWITSFNSDGFSFAGQISGTGDTNASPSNYVDWMWRAGDTAVTNTSGSITSQVSANQEAGFSIVTYTGTGANATVGHGLGVAPKMVIVKEITNVDGNNWNVWHYKTSGAVSTRLQLNTSVADVGDGSTIWNTVPSSSTVGLGASIGCNGSTRPYIMYCFAEVPGYSKIGKYTGNSSTNGPFVYCGFRPKYVLIKCSQYGGAGYDWIILDSLRDLYNPNNNDLMADLSQVEGTANVYDIDFVANGFKIRSNYGTVNGTAEYVFYAVAEAPFQYANAR